MYGNLKCMSSDQAIISSSIVCMYGIQLIVPLSRFDTRFDEAIIASSLTYFSNLWQSEFISAQLIAFNLESKTNGIEMISTHCCNALLKHKIHQFPFDNG
eukprot:1056222_1